MVIDRVIATIPRFKVLISHLKSTSLALRDQMMTA